MKDWIKDLSDKQLEDLLCDSRTLAELSPEKKANIKHMIQNFQDFRLQPQLKKKSDRPIFNIFYSRLSLIFAISILMISIPVFIYRYYPDLINSNPADNLLKTSTTHNIRIKQMAQIVRKGKNIRTAGNFKIRPKDTILNNSANILNLYEDKKISMVLNPQTEIFIKNIRQNNETCFELIKGSMDINIINSENSIKYLFLTPHAVINVIGTSLSIQIRPDDKTRVTVQEGHVLVKQRYSNSNPVKLIINQTVLVSNQNMQLGNQQSKIVNTNQSNIENAKTKKNIKVQNNVRTINRIQKIYEDKKFKSNNAVLSIKNNGNQIIVQTQKSIIAFDHNLEIVWENKPGDNKSVIFQSKPYLDRNNLYNVTLQKQLLLLNPASGRQNKAEIINGNLVFGNQPVLYGQSILLPLSTGVYSTKDCSKPLINFYNPNTPQVINNHLFLTSYVSKTIALYNQDFEVEWKQFLDSRSFSSSIYLEKTIINATSAGIIYFLNIKGNIIKTINVNMPITGNLVQYNKLVYFLSDDGFLNKIDLNSYKVVKILKIDNNPHLDNYLYKNPIFDKNMIVIGNNMGEIVFINLANFKQINRIKISESPVSCSILPYNSKYLIGTENGSLFTINYQKK